MKINLQYHGKSKKNVGNVENRKLAENSSQFSTCKETFNTSYSAEAHGRHKQQEAGKSQQSRTAQLRCHGPIDEF
jgi:hypothetical protein